MIENAFVFAAGRGERLRPLTDSCPKPLLPLAGRPILAWIFDQLERLSLKRVVVNVFYLKEPLKDYLQEEAKKRSFEICISEEFELLGTAGGLKFAQGWLKEQALLTINGDVYCEFDWKSFLERAQSLEADGHWALTELKTLQTPVFVGDDHRVLKIGELWEAKGVKPADLSQAFCFSGVQYIPRLDWQALPERGCLVRDYWLSQLQKGSRLLGHQGLFKAWADLGSPESYQYWDRQLQKEAGLR